jgi:hypothetical protein
MNKQLKDRILREGIVDTDKYRYTLKELPDRTEIRRLPIEYLDTTAAIDGWEVVEALHA